MLKEKKGKLGPWICGGVAGIVNGLFGAGGGMVLIPLLTKLTDVEEKEAFACSVGIILPLSVVSVIVYFLRGGDFGAQSVPYLIGGAIGGIGAGLLLKKVKAKWLHRALGLFILYGGYRLLCR